MVDKFYHPKVHTGWHKDQSPEYRRRLALKAHKGDYLSTARAMQALVNVTTDAGTRRAAQSDADYFYDMHRKHK